MVRRFINRDLSWIAFNRRVLECGLASELPLFEALRFLGIFSSNLDEFFMKRVGALKRRVAAQKPTLLGDALLPSALLAQVREQVIALEDEAATHVVNVLISRIREHGIELLNWDQLTPDEIARSTEYFRARVFPLLTPLAVDPAHPFPFLSNLSLSLGVKLRAPKARESHFARIKIPEFLPAWVNLSDSSNARFILLRDIVQHCLGELFPEMVIENVMAFRVTRNADIEQVYDDAEDLRETVEEELRMRRLGDVVRLQVEAPPDPWILGMLLDELELSMTDVYEHKSLLTYRHFAQIVALDVPALRFRPWSPLTPKAFAGETSEEVFAALRERDLLVHHPYESFSGSVERLLRAAVEDPQVLAIKITLYRTGEKSPIIPLLIEAAEQGKQVVCVVEVKARFDEARNLQWSEMLEKAGVHVMVGVVGLKTHAKMMLIVRKEGEDFRFYAHIGTGNYHSENARLYEDFGLFTTDPSITGEMVEIFNYLTGLSLRKSYRKFLISPINMRERFMELISKETENARAGGTAQIIAKMNSLEDVAMCEALYQASQAGVSVDLIVRGLCILIPGVPGVSENIRVRSIVGRFLEHSRVYYFRSGAKEPQDGKIYLSSADWMARNLNHRVEIAVPIDKRALKKTLWQLLQSALADQRQSWVLAPDGTYARVLTDDAQATLGLHDQLMEQATERNSR